MTTDSAGAGVSVELQGIYDGVLADGLALVVEMVVYGSFSSRPMGDTKCSFELVSSSGFYASMVLFSTTIIA